MVIHKIIFFCYGLVHSVASPGKKILVPPLDDGRRRDGLFNVGRLVHANRSGDELRRRGPCKGRQWVVSVDGRKQITEEKRRDGWSPRVWRLLGSNGHTSLTVSVRPFLLSHGFRYPVVVRIRGEGGTKVGHEIKYQRNIHVLILIFGFVCFWFTRSQFTVRSYKRFWKFKKPLVSVRQYKPHVSPHKWSQTYGPRATCDSRTLSMWPATGIHFEQKYTKRIVK